MSNSPYFIQTTNLPTGQPIAGASVVVYLTGTTTKANVYNSTGGAISNPLTSDSNAIAAFWLADGQFYDVVWSSGSYVSETLTIGKGAALRATASTNIVIAVGYPAGSTLPGGGTALAPADSPTSINCATVKQALYNLANNYDHNGYTPTIQCYGPNAPNGGGSALVFGGGCVLSFDDNPGWTGISTPGALTPQFLGTFMLVLDMGGSILDGGAQATAGSFVAGVTYCIQSVGTTNFTAIGAASNTVGTIFTATGAGSGTGTAVGGTGYTVCLRMTPLALQIQNGTFQQASGFSSTFYSYGGNAQIEIGPRVTLGQFGPNGTLVNAGSFVPGTQYVIVTAGTTNFVAIGAAKSINGLQFTATGAGSGTGTAAAGGNSIFTGAFVCQATRGGAIRLRPGLSGANRMVINLGTYNIAASLFTSLIAGGSIELEGSEIYIQGWTTFSVGVLSATNVSQLSLSNLAWTGGLFCGPQAFLGTGGNIQTNDLTGGQVVNIPANPQMGTSATTVTTNNYSITYGSNYLPGSLPLVIQGNESDIDFWPDLPALPGNAGTGAALQGCDQSFTFGIGAGATSPVNILLATVTNWRNAVWSCSNPAALPNLTAVFVGPTDPATPGYVSISWTGTYSGGALGAYVFVHLRNGTPK